MKNYEHFFTPYRILKTFYRGEDIELSINGKQTRGIIIDRSTTDLTIKDSENKEQTILLSDITHITL